MSQQKLFGAKKKKAIKGGRKGGGVAKQKAKKAGKVYVKAYTRSKPK